MPTRTCHRHHIFCSKPSPHQRLLLARSPPLTRPQNFRDPRPLPCSAGPLKPSQLDLDDTTAPRLDSEPRSVSRARRSSRRPTPPRRKPERAFYLAMHGALLRAAQDPDAQFPLLIRVPSSARFHPKPNVQDLTSVGNEHRPWRISFCITPSGPSSPSVSAPWRAAERPEAGLRRQRPAAVPGADSAGPTFWVLAQSAFSTKSAHFSPQDFAPRRAASLPRVHSCGGNSALSLWLVTMSSRAVLPASASTKPDLQQMFRGFCPAGPSAPALLPAGLCCVSKDFAPRRAASCLEVNAASTAWSPSRQYCLSCCPGSLRGRFDRHSPHPSSKLACICAAPDRQPHLDAAALLPSPLHADANIRRTAKALDCDVHSSHSSSSCGAQFLLSYLNSQRSADVGALRQPACAI
uniref:Uncharacterized protein n=1 Tax=Mycena chlorophos TaxID=658473 RepID=A0ABQ0L6C6_MYCCL|nr:predicted protein [Mycena chlorophos]